jgi:hypothetical protein
MTPECLDGHNHTNRLFVGSSVLVGSSSDVRAGCSSARRRLRRRAARRTDRGNSTHSSSSAGRSSDGGRLHERDLEVLPGPRAHDSTSTRKPLRRKAEGLLELAGVCNPFARGSDVASDLRRCGALRIVGQRIGGVCGGQRAGRVSCSRAGETRRRRTRDTTPPPDARNVRIDFACGSKIAEGLSLRGRISQTRHERLFDQR